MKKAEILTHWSAIAAEGVTRDLVPSPVPYKHEGSTYQEDGIRITGSREWIDSVLSRLSDMLEYEANGTRLQLNYQPSKDRETGELLGSWNCYVQVHERGPDAAAVNCMFNLIEREAG